MPSYTSDALVTLPSEDTAVARIHSLPACREAGEPLTSETSGYLNQLTLAEGGFLKIRGNASLSRSTSPLKTFPSAPPSSFLRKTRI